MDSELARQRLSDAEARKLRLEITVTDMQTVAESARGATKAEVKSYLSRLKHLRLMERSEQALLIKEFVERIEVFPAGDGGDRQIKIKTKLDRLLVSSRIEKAAVSLRQRITAILIQRNDGCFIPKTNI